MSTERHPLDRVSLLAGLIFMVVAGLALTDRLVRFDANWLSWLLPAVLVLAGVAVLVRTARDHRGAKR
ncbi:MAG: hypothetical protein BRC32_00950 [Actinobacteria bacterium QS_8_72_14]|nr:MAG: hypothetical protein BRC32_00950 [Actinobacteria bacterium QS_8_72_14]